jgi:hypothetical protein
VPNQVDKGDLAFARRFIVASKDAAWARQILGKSLQGVFVQSDSEAPVYSEMDMGPGGAVIITGAHAPPSSGRPWWSWPAASNGH